MSDTNDVAEPPKRTRAAKKESGRRKYAESFADLERRVRLAIPVLQNSTAEDALMRIKIACDILTGA